MEHDDPLPGVAAHGLLNELTSMQGLLAAARTLAVRHGAESKELLRLISAAEVRAGAMAEQLHLLARGVPIIIDLQRAPDDPSARSAPEGDA